MVKIKTFNWKSWLDRILILDFFIVVLGSLFFLIAILMNLQGISIPFQIFQKLWIPLFIPAITIFICSILISGLLSLLQRKLPLEDQDT